MNPKQNVQRHEFGRRLEQLLLSANIKNATIASALNYDVSYISKWISGKAYPSRKNIEGILVEISSLIIGQASEKAYGLLQKYYGTKDRSDLQEAIINSLRNAYYETIGEVNETQYSSNASMHVLPQGKFPLMDDFAKELNIEKDLSVLVMADIFALDHTAKLQLAGIESRHFRLKMERENLQVDYIIDLSTLRGDSVYDVILLIHMMTNFSLCKFRLYYSRKANDKLMIAVRNEFAGVSVIGIGRQILYTTATRDKKTVNEMYDGISGMVDPDQLVFYATNMDTMLMRHEYFHNLLSKNNRWLVGHVTEHFVPESLFRQLLTTRFEEKTEEFGEAERTYILTANMLKKGHTKIVMYNLALADFVLTGELDFFNQKVILPVEQRQQVLRYIKELVNYGNGHMFKLIKEGFSDDFKYITNPCLFLSDTASYLRLENKVYEKNLLLVKAETAKNIFDVFYETIWSCGREMLIEETEAIIEKIDNLLEMSDLM